MSGDNNECPGHDVSGSGYKVAIKIVHVRGIQGCLRAWQRPRRFCRCAHVRAPRHGSSSCEWQLDGMGVVFVDGSRDDLPGVREWKLGGIDRDFVIGSRGDFAGHAGPSTHSELGHLTEMVASTGLNDLAQLGNHGGPNTSTRHGNHGG